MSDKQYHHGDLKASLITAANTILQRDGTNALSLRAIAAEVGVSHMAPYAHFKNKNQLLSSVIESGFVLMADAMETCTAHLDKNDAAVAGELVLAYGVSYLEFAMANPQLYRLMLGQVDTSGVKAPASQPSSPTDPRSENAQLRRPFNLLRSAFALQSEDSSKVKAQAIGAWAMVHGMAALMTEGHIQLPQGVNLKQYLADASSVYFKLKS
ncbi:TetR/AcrR family transcriptional regulator [Shewanella sp. UCD-KL21]|uniref:TetR/AcrR family transcriptional regulator n=1 Tax=Shewanella sp. UCD-KL21 TaxID=1917164 RepID=UPI0009704CBF|nr:TetR/AcrR family transcriptional regulator [Shewanella sp. UCD-KL21]